ncbi:MAG: hypothetical protein AAB432_01695 [Patescibacteria group bacterium]
MSRQGEGQSFLNRPRAAKSKHWFWFSMLGVFIFGGFLIGFCYLIFYAGFLKVKSFDISGGRIADNVTLTSNLTVAALGENYPLSILGPDSLIFWYFSKSPVAPNLSLPSVSAIEKKVVIFQGKVEIAVRERQIVGFWCVNGNDCYGFDENGVAFSAAPLAEGALILRVSDDNARPLILGKSVLPQKIWFDNLMRVLKTIEAAGFSPTAVEIKDFALREWQLTDTTGLNFYFSFNFAPENLASVLQSLKQRFAEINLAYLDFRIPNRIYYK